MIEMKYIEDKLGIIGPHLYSLLYSITQRPLIMANILYLVPLTDTDYVKF